MDFGRCDWCGGGLALCRRGARFCSTKCRVYWHREAAKIPARMTSERRWVRADGKRPIAVDGSPASSTDAGTWSRFAEVRAGRGDGFGFMLGGGVGCYDLDHVSDADARDFIAGLTEPVIYAERSMSGEGVHVFVEAPEERGWKRGNVERYTRERFIRMTGNRFEF